MVQSENTVITSASLNFNAHFITCLDVAQYIVRVMSARARSDKLPGFHKQIVFTF